MMFCPKCGKPIEDDAEICIHCGRRVKPIDCRKNENPSNNILANLIINFAVIVFSKMAQFLIFFPFVLNGSTKRIDGLALLQYLFAQQSNQPLAFFSLSYLILLIFSELLVVMKIFETMIILVKKKHNFELTCSTVVLNLFSLCTCIFAIAFFSKMLTTNDVADIGAVLFFIYIIAISLTDLTSNLIKLFHKK